MKIRLDKLLIQRGLAESIERAQALILAARVLIENQPAAKPGIFVDPNAAVRLLGENPKYVSRGGIKLEAALDHWQINVAGKICLDVGTSTGGFTDCLLQHGAAKVIAVDTGRGQIDFKLRQDSRVRLLEKTNARWLKQAQLVEAIDLVVIDVSFISITSVIPAVMAAAFGGAMVGREIIVLVKPQFEVEREYVEKGGIVRNPEAQRASVEKVRRSLLELECTEIEMMESPILGAEGNREFFLRAKF